MIGYSVADANRNIGGRNYSGGKDKGEGHPPHPEITRGYIAQ